MFKNQTKITRFFKSINYKKSIINKKNNNTSINKSKIQKRMNDYFRERYLHLNLCTVCGINMGHCNPRQYCCKTYCPDMFN